jgi:hypothetical protein
MSQTYEELVREHRAWFKAVRKTYCPLLNEDIHFTSKGFYHLLHDGLSHPRSRKERMYRLGLIPLVIPVIKSASKVLEYKKEYSKKLGKIVEYWKLQETVGKHATLVSIILRKIGTGQINFYSVWKKKDKQKNHQ